MCGLFGFFDVFPRVSQSYRITYSTTAGPRAYHGTVCLGHTIYIVGGFDGIEHFNSVRSFDPVLKTWAEVAPMNAKRYVYY